MANSFTIAGLELIGATTNPEYRLGTGMDGGSITPDTVTLSSLSLDGDFVAGRRTPNKQWSFTVQVNGADRPTLSKNIDTLLNAVAADDVSSFPVVWTPSGCPSTNFTAFRAAATVQKNMVGQDQGWVSVLIQFATGPFGESSVAQVITVPATGGPPTLQVDGMNSSTFTGATMDTTTMYEGAGSAAVVLTKAGSGQYGSPATVGRSITSLDLSSYASIGVRVRVQQVPPLTSPDMGTLALFLTLTSTGGGTATGIAAVNTRKDGSFYLAQFATALLSKTTSPAFDWTQVTTWSCVLATSSRTQSAFDPAQVTAWLDDLRAFPPGSVVNSTAEGGVLTIPGVLGSARTPAAVQVFRAPAAQASGNILTAADSSVETIGNWIATSGDTVLSSTAQALQGTHSLALTATGSGGMQASNLAAAKAAVNPNTVYTVTASSKAAATPRLFSVGVIWVDKSGAFARVDVVGPVNDTTSGWTTATANFTSPSNAQFVFLTLVYASSATSEVHYVDAVGVIVGASKPWVIGTGTYTVPSTLPITNALVHFPPGDQDPDATIFAGLSAGTVTIPSPNMNYNDTFSLAVLFSATAGVGVSRVITVTLTQKLGAATVATQTLTATVIGTQTIASISQAGQQVTLPLFDIPAENTNSSLIIAVSSANGSDTISDVALCSTRGQTILATGLAATNTTLYVDKPDPAVGIGPVYASATDRTQATNAQANLNAYVGPPYLEPGADRVLVASTSGAPSIIATASPRWLEEALA